MASLCTHELTFLVLEREYTWITRSMPSPLVALTLQINVSLTHTSVRGSIIVVPVRDELAILTELAAHHSKCGLFRMTGVITLHVVWLVEFVRFRFKERGK